MKRMITLELGFDEALLLFETLADLSKEAELPVRDSAERLALLRLHGSIKRTLVELFAPDYAQLVEAARDRLRSEYGEMTDALFPPLLPALHNPVAGDAQRLVIQTCHPPVVPAASHEFTCQRFVYRR